jgi:hypothetical protein
VYQSDVGNLGTMVKKSGVSMILRAQRIMPFEYVEAEILSAWNHASLLAFGLAMPSK